MSTTAVKTIIACPSCSREYHVEPKYIGRQVTCDGKTCGTTFTAKEKSPARVPEPSTPPKPKTNAELLNAAFTPKTEPAKPLESDRTSAYALLGDAFMFAGGVILLAAAGQSNIGPLAIGATMFSFGGRLRCCAKGPLDDFEVVMGICFIIVACLTSFGSILLPK